MKYKFIEELKALLLEKDPELYAALGRDSVWSPNLIGRALQMVFPDCPVGTSSYRDGTTIKWLEKHYSALLNTEEGEPLDQT